MKNIKSFCVSFFICVLFINADCNKVDETPVFNGYILEGRLVNSCTDNTPLKNRTFLLRDENDKLNDYSITAKTDSNGYFKIKSEMKGRSLIIEDGFGTGKTILYKIPGGQSINFGDIAYDFTMGIKLIYKDFKNLTSSDSLFINAQGVNPTNPYRSSYIKGPLSSDNLGVIYLKETPMYLNRDSTKGYLYIYKNLLNASTVISKKNYLISTNCLFVQEVVFE